MYIEEAVDPLVDSLTKLCSSKTEVLLAYGRNRFAEDHFIAKCQPIFSIVEVSSRDLDEKYQCVDVTVLKLQRHSQTKLAEHRTQ